MFSKWFSRFFFKYAVGRHCIIYHAYFMQCKWIDSRRTGRPRIAYVWKSRSYRITRYKLIHTHGVCTECDTGLLPFLHARAAYTGKTRWPACINTIRIIRAHVWGNIGNSCSVHGDPKFAILASHTCTRY